MAIYRLNTTKYVLNGQKSNKKCQNLTKKSYPHCPTAGPNKLFKQLEILKIGKFIPSFWF